MCFRSAMKRKNIREIKRMSTSILVSPRIELPNMLCTIYIYLYAYIYIYIHIGAIKGDFPILRPVLSNFLLHQVTSDGF
jgi:hypothetical protein